MINIKKISLIFLSILFISSCHRKVTNQIVQESNFEHHDESFLDGMGTYKNEFIRTYGFQYIKYTTQLYQKHVDFLTAGFTQNSLNKNTKDSFYINDFNVKPANLNKKTGNQFLGKKIKMKYVDKNNNMVYSKKIYLPKEIIIDTIASKISRHNEANTGEYSLGHSIYYNQDKNNKNGLLISLGSGDNDLRTFYKPNDDGVIHFPKSFFEKIKDDTYLTLFIKRGSNNKFDLQNDSYLIMANTSVCLPLFSNKD